MAIVPISAIDAGKRFGVASSTIRQWACRYNARRLGSVGQRVYYDFADLATIDLLIRRQLPIPTDPRERDRIRLEFERERLAQRRALGG